MADLSIYSKLIEGILVEPAPVSQRKLFDRYTALHEDQREAFVLALIFECCMWKTRFEQERRPVGAPA
jgi:hypothetical protein